MSPTVHMHHFECLREEGGWGMVAINRLTQVKNWGESFTSFTNQTFKGREHNNHK